MDLNMPVMDGYTASTEIQKRINKKLYPKMTIIAATGEALN